ncbi:ATP-dependent DNA helicase Hrp3, partial [Elasticomyces elasticus]
MDIYSSSDESIRPSKKRPIHSDEDDEDYIRNNPDLYGLRRSGRARPAPNMAESSDEDSDVVSRPRKRLRPNSQPSSKQQTPAGDSADDASDVSDEYGGRHKKLIRFSTRRNNKISTYNEDDVDPFEEDNGEMLTPNYWPTEQDNTPAIDSVLDHRLKVDVTTPQYVKEEYEFLIKWQQQAYYHATWETLESLSGVKSIRRLENYIKKILLEDIRIVTDNDISMEDKEKWVLDREQVTDAIEDYKTVERVIASQSTDAGTEYYVKWKGLFYDNATWETSELISSIAQQKIDQFLHRQQETFRSNSEETSSATRSKFSKIDIQPSYVKFGQLRDFQLLGLNFLAFNWTKNMNVVLADEMGLGKTVQTVAFINWLRHDREQHGPFLVAVPLSTMPAWADTFDLWAPDIHYVVYNGNNAARQIIRDYELFPGGNVKHPRFHVLLTTYEYVLTDSHILNQIKWQFMAIDEAHRLKNRESQLYDKLREFKVPSRLLITGTPVQNNLGELSALFDFISPGVVNIDENMDLTTEAASAKIAKLTEDIKPYMLRRTKQKVEKDLPPKSEKIIRVELSDVQLEYYKNILTKNYAALNQGAKGQKQSLLNIMMELKKASNHPYLFPSCEDRIVPAGARKEEILKALVTSS